MGEDKLFMDLAGKPVLARTLTALNACSCVDEIVVVTRLESLEKVAALFASFPHACIVRIKAARPVVDVQADIREAVRRLFANKGLPCAG